MSINYMHPINDIRGSVSSRLKDKRIVLGITGSISAVETIRMARELARHGADVIPVMSEAATRIIHPDAIHFATGHQPIIRLDGAVKHVELCGETSSRADLLLIAPSTANTISKIAHGIDDTPVTTMATCAMGSKMPIIIVPAMHGSMYKHEILLDNIQILKDHGVIFVQPRVEEGKAKIASRDDIVHSVIHCLGDRSFASKKVLVITGPTSEPIDDVRVITNRSTGFTGVQLALEAYYRGADVEVWASRGMDVPDMLNVKRFETVGDLEKLANDAKADVILVPAAISDFLVEKHQGKVSSSKSATIELTQAPKILGLLRKNTKALIVGFKAETGIGLDELETRAIRRMKEHGLGMIIANLMEDVGSYDTKAMILRKDGKKDIFNLKKSELATIVFDIIKGE
ncbi:MAG: bifunctional phosphopantothenoylcysteine decarboxylase/phosphopantothenate--cysteine ligase CoaBC [Thermoplasmata archaeon]|nr:bifunctional phosphopantothenoylcysteine decarboxylase/phosphopantothenate--cysteine ligase CoaBC [Thermoplasmata archaeon]